MYRNVQLVLASLFIALYALSAIARRYPDIRWLQRFGSIFPQPSEAQRERLRRQANVYVGVEMILIGICLPLAYAALKLMFFNSFTTLGVVSVLAGSALCIGIGITAIVRRAKD